MASDKISLKGLDKAEVLAVIYNASKPQGMGFLHYNPEPMTRDEARRLLEVGSQTYFDYLNGRVMKIDISGEELSVWRYDRDNGQGAAERAIASLRSSGKTDSKLVKKVHALNTRDSARNAKIHLNGETPHPKGLPTGKSATAEWGIRRN